MIVAHEQIAERVRELYRAGGLPAGASTGWPSVDKLYTVGLSQWTLITGTPNSGKSEWLDALLVNLLSREHWHFAIYSPEYFPLELHYSSILEKIVGKPFGPGPTERMSEDERDRALEFIRGRFFFCKPERPTLQAILEEAAGIAFFSSKANPPQWKPGIVIDPWNQLEHCRPQGLSETEYVSQELSRIIEWVRELRCHLWLVAHPSKLYRDKEGKLPIPTPSDVSGSAHFWNKSDNCLTVWRDQVEGKQEVEIHVQKVRFRHIGRIGMTTLRYDKVTGRYSENLKAVDQPRRYGDE